MSAPIVLAATAAEAAASTATTSTVAGAVIPTVQKSTIAVLSKGAIFAYRFGFRFVRNTRITPIATYIAYKASGLADSGALSGIAISDLVEGGKKGKNLSAEEKELAKYGKSGARGRARVAAEKSKERPSIEEVVKRKLENVAEENREQVKRDVVTTEVIERTQGRAARRAQQPVDFHKRRRHFCLQEGCTKDAL
ncbi:hypothetical protein MBLNU457_g1130t1 [Dothideomycetes sp. NU457]